ncbi:succinyl-diaminopimelate desuccinylase [Fontibacillus panacisegetis]|uniref:Succinyl-diaminopimelate desuccinylase n=1 Tax=Fontibacillus panacisegetis TaxID=670482 RepID=A0A1G7QKX5_9BACL|nr:M20 family metallopeptidase [Fontibacillus panacisegetis]SDF98280.1 succinyl-diaminopimelate desuccinylase [Fontibacillus panacisegetis]
MNNRDDAVQLLQEMIRTNTCNPPGHEHQLSLLIKSRLDRLGIDNRIDVLDEEGFRSNLEAVIKGKSGDSTRKLILCGHLDTVAPWSESAGKYSPHGGTIENNRLYGRGASDMKSGLAAMLLAFESIQREGTQLDGDLIFLATAGEEVDSCGAADYACRVGLQNVDGVIIAEPTAGKVVVGHKGALWLRIVVKGQSSHGSMPELGVNAIEHMMEVVACLKAMEDKWKANDPILGSSSMAITRIHGGVQTNITPDHCEIEVDIRTVPPIRHSELLQKIEYELEVLREQVPKLNYTVTPILDRQAIRTDDSHNLIAAALDLVESENRLVQGVSYYTDGSVLNKNGDLPILIYGPGDPKLAHQPDEWVDIDEYVRSIDFYRDLIIGFLGTTK